MSPWHLRNTCNTIAYHTHPWHPPLLLLKSPPKASNPTNTRKSSIDPKANPSSWQPVSQIFKRQTNTLINIRTSLGRTLTVTPDHPMSIGVNIAMRQSRYLMLCWKSNILLPLLLSELAQRYHRLYLLTGETIEDCYKTALLVYVWHLPRLIRRFFFVSPLHL